MRRPVTMADLRSGRYDLAGAHLHCSAECGNEYSATPGDYWNLPNSHVFECECGAPLVLMRKRTVFEPVRARKGRAAP